MGGLNYKQSATGNITGKAAGKAEQAVNRKGALAE